ncbi:kinase-like domain-containing protein, partial [Gorgonomyces haynaldii]
MQSLRINTNDFDVIKTLATGAVGRVCLVRSKADKNVYAMKVLKKHDLLTRREAQFFMEERNALVFSQQSVWITTLFAAFQDVEHLYLVMEYVSGGSLRALMNNRETIMEEPEARFYMAEMVLALDALHKLNYMHRDIKPENYLIDSKGHIKLADFGSCIGIAEASKITSHETVGTPDYISPEVLRAIEGGASYGLSVDWWSLGIILFELLYDEVPFYSESLTETYGKIMDHEKYFVFPSDIKVSDQCKQLMSKLICSQDVRYKTAEEIMQHEWFAGVNWRNIRETDAPFIPQLSGPEDTRYFEDEDNE